MPLYVGKRPPLTSYKKLALQSTARVLSHSSSSSKVYKLKRKISTPRSSSRDLEDDGTLDKDQQQLQAAETHHQQPTVFWQTLQTQSQLWAVILPLGYAGVPLTSSALNALNIPNSSALAAVSMETLSLIAVLTLLRYHKIQPTVISDVSIHKQLIYGPLAAVAALVINQLLFAGASNTDATAALLTSHDPIAITALFTAGVVLAPITEELIYRSFLLDSLRSGGFSKPAAIAVSAALFAVAHLDAGVQGTMQLFVVGCCLGIAYAAGDGDDGNSSSIKGSLAASVLGHSVYNGVLFGGLLFHF